MRTTAFCVGTGLTSLFVLSDISAQNCSKINHYYCTIIIIIIIIVLTTLVEKIVDTHPTFISFVIHRTISAETIYIIAPT